MKIVRDTNFPGQYKDNIESALNTDINIPASYYSDVTNDWEESDGSKITPVSFDLMIKRRNLYIIELNSQTESLDEQIAVLNAQKALYADKKTQAIQQITELYREYTALLQNGENLERSMPVNFLTDGRIIKGYNATGNLVAIYDRYENYAVIEYETYPVGLNGSGERISRIYDNTDKQVVFTYNESNRLADITDVRGRKRYFTYDETNNRELLDIAYDTGEKITFAYLGDNINSLSEAKSGMQCLISYSSDYKPMQITNYSLKSSISQDSLSTGVIMISDNHIEYTPTTGYPVTSATVTEDQTKEKYLFDENGNCTGYRKAEYDNESAQYLVVAAEEYTHNPYWIGDEQQSDPKEVVVSAARSSLYTTALGSYTFVSGDTETTTLNQFNNPISKTTNEILLSVWKDSSGTEQQNSQKTTVDYTYDDNQKIIEEKTTVEYTNPIRSFVSYKRYNYNSFGDVIRTETFVENEENKTGKTIEETVYDEKGNVTRSFTYNSLDSSTKFYTESEYTEEGRVIADYDETGENKTEYGYVDGTSVVRTRKLPNGSKLAYGHDKDDTVTSITQSTEEGEENSTHTRYTCGEVTELVSGNNLVRYEYDGKRRVRKVFLNDTGNAYLQNTYTDDTTLDGVTVDKCVSVNAKGETTTSYTDKQGRLLRIERPDGQVLQYQYEHGKLKIVKNGGGTTMETYEYDTLDRQTSHMFVGHVRATEYDNYGQTAKETVTFNSSSTDKHEYVYSYDYMQAKNTLTGLTAGAFSESYEQDKNGRNASVIQSLGGQTYTKRYGYYKCGDHATNRINTIYYSRNGISDGKSTYTYDCMGNIISVNENGKQRYIYTYDGIGRIISEKDLYNDEEVCYTYDNKGNILSIGFLFLPR